MDPVTLAGLAVGLLVPFVKKLGEKVADRISDGLADAADGKVRALYEQVRAKLAKDRYTAELLEGVEAEPDSGLRRTNLEATLAEELGKDEGFASAVEQLVAEAQQAGAVVVPIQAGDTGAIAGRDFVQRGGTNIGRDQVNYGTSPPVPPTR